MGINAKDFGAQGDGTTDDAPALQKAIDAATATGVPWLVPAGTYAINTTLSIPAIIAPVHPLRLVGAGAYTTTIVAGGAPLHALLNFTSLSGPRGPATPTPYEDASVTDISLDAGNTANYSVFAPSIARSRFSRVGVSGALIAGMSLGYGWCIYIDECRFSGNGAMGLHTYNAGNNVDVVNRYLLFFLHSFFFFRFCMCHVCSHVRWYPNDKAYTLHQSHGIPIYCSIFEGNDGVAYYASGGEQIKVSGCVIEGNGGPGVIAVAIKGLTLLSNYFEVGYSHSCLLTSPPFFLFLMCF